MRILIVDDSRFTRALLRRELDREHEIVEAAHGRDGLAILRQSPPDVVLVDLLMPVMNGYEFVKEARRLGYSGPVVVCTANTQAAVESRVREIGATEFVTKPDLLVPGKARTLVAQVLRRRRAEIAASSRAESVPDPGLEVLIADAMSALAEALSALTSLPVRLGATRIEKRMESGIAPVAAEGAPVRVTLAVDGGLTGRATLHLPDAEILDATTGHLAPDRGSRESHRDLAEEVGTILVNAFICRLADRTEPEIRLSGLEDVEPGGSGPGGGHGPVVIASGFTLSGLGREALLHLEFDDAAWCRIVDGLRRSAPRPPE